MHTKIVLNHPVTDEEFIANVEYDFVHGENDDYEKCEQLVIVSVDFTSDKGNGYTPDPAVYDIWFRRIDKAMDKL